MKLSQDRWQRMNAEEREGAARRIAKELPAGFSFVALQTFKVGEAQQQVATFKLREAAFSLVPGGPATIGFDENRAWQPSAEELESWESTAQEYGLEKSIHEQIVDLTLRPRQIEVPPLLVEAQASEVGWEPIGVEDPEVQRILREHRGRGQVQMHRGEICTRVRWTDNGTLIAERAMLRTHVDLVAQMRASGFRFPTSNEWEYLCGGGAATLFRWGDHVPCNRYPTATSPEEAAWRRAWVISGGKLEYPAEGFTADFDQHRRPNLFGLSIAADPYHYELVAEPGVARGGDGGCTICGGAGFFVGWLTLATAYFEEDTCQCDPADPIMAGHVFGRRLLELQ